MALRTDFKNDILDTEKNTERLYNIKDRSGAIIQENVRFEDVTDYEQEGSFFGANELNETNKTVNELTDSLNNFSFRLNPSSNKKEVSTDGGNTWSNFSSGAELIWTNPAPSSSFENKTLDLDLSNYEYIIIEIAENTSYINNIGLNLVPIDGQQHYVYSNSKSNGDTRGVSRCISNITHNSIVFYYGYNPSADARNNYAIPKRIWGCGNLFE